MKIRLRRAPLVTILALLAGCAGANQEKAYTDEIGKSGFRLVSYTGTTRGAYIWPDGKSGHICAEPPPDLGLTTAREISANLKAAASTLGAIASPSIDAGGAAKLSSAAIELAGRSQLVLLAREFLYRECELAANFGPGSEQYRSAISQNEQILHVVLQLAEADIKRAAAEYQETLNKAAELNKTQDAKIAVIAAAVSKSDGSLDQEVLRKALAMTKLDDSVKNAVASRTTIPDLVDFLRQLPDAEVQALLDALSKKG
jgi:hypothetical protein